MLHYYKSKKSFHDNSESVLTQIKLHTVLSQSFKYDLEVGKILLGLYIFDQHVVNIHLNIVAYLALKDFINKELGVVPTFFRLKDMTP